VEITEVRVKLMEDGSERLQAFCSITLDDCFVVRDLKIIEGANGPFVAMPSRKLTSHCPQCGCKNHLRAAYCNQCGTRLKEDRVVKDADGRAKLYADIAHPINSDCREMIQNRVIKEFYLEQDRAHQPGYVSRYDDFDSDVEADIDEVEGETETKQPARPAGQTHIQSGHKPQAPHKPQGAPKPGTPHLRPKDAPKPQSQDSDDRSEGGFGAGIL